jgi:hypothetical protein
MKHILSSAMFLFLSVNAIHASDGVDGFWDELKKLCGKAFEGQLVTASANDDSFVGKRLVMHVRSCEENRIRIPFFVGEDRSRTWILTRVGKDRILLKHDHRHEDGTPDAVTMYGGTSTNIGTKSRQVFPADDETVKVIAAAATNVWWIDLNGGESYVYNLRRMGTERHFSVKFDLTKTVEPPPAPWGWQD